MADPWGIGDGVEQQEGTALQESIARLAAALPPIYRNQWPAFVFLDKRIAIDLEWDPKTGALQCIGVGNEDWVSQWWWQELNTERHEAVRNSIQCLIAARTVIYQNADIDIRKMRGHGFDVTAAMHHHLEDTMLAHAVLHCEYPHDLEYLSLTFGKLPPHKHLMKVAPDLYNAGDVVETCFVWDALERQFVADPAARFIYRTMSIPMIDLAIEGEEAGIRVDKSKPYPLHDEYSTKIAQAEMLAQAGTGWPINLDSPKQMKMQLYDIQKFPVQRKKAPYGMVGEVTTNKDAIANLRRSLGVEWDPEDLPTLEQALANIEGESDTLLEARYLHMGAQQALSHYVMPFFELDAKGAIVGVKDRIFPELRQHVQTSGRHSYVGPAVQQMRDKRLAAQITPDVGACWVGHDWSNIEVWILAGLSGDELLLKAKAEGWDTHTVNYCDISGTPYPPRMTKALHTAPCNCTMPTRSVWSVEPELHPLNASSCCAAWREKYQWLGDEDLRRLFTKRFIFRLHYRGKPEHAGDIPGAKSLGFNTDRLVAASERYLSKHPAIVEFWKRVEHEADKYGVVYTFMGRPRELTSEYRNARNREACNHPMQGGVADIYVSTALLVKKAAPWARLVYGAHDSQWWQVPVARRLEFQAIYVPIVTRSFQIGGREMSFPASWKMREAA